MDKDQDKRNRIILVREERFYVIKYTDAGSGIHVHFPYSNKNEQEVKLEAEIFKQRLKNNLHLEEYTEPADVVISA